MDKAELLEKYIKPILAYESNPVGAMDIVGALGKNMGITALSGIKGLSELPHGTDAAANAIRAYQEKYNQPSLSPQGIQAIRDIAPTFRGAAAGPIGDAARAVSGAYGEGSQQFSDLAGRHLGPVGAGIAGAVADTAPMMMTPEGMLGKEVAALAPRLHPDTFKPLLDDGAHRLTLEREAVANQRRLEDGIQTGEVQPSDFAGRQAEHEGAVAQRAKEKTPRQIHVLPGPESHLADEVPDNANVYVSTHPETGELQGYAVTVPYGGAHRMTDIHVNPEHRRQGIGKDLFNRAVAGAHDEGLPFHSDTSVTPEQMANVQHSGHIVEMNPDVSERETSQGGNEHMGPVLMSNNGSKPVYTIPVPVAAEDATADEVQPGDWIKNQAYAKGGEVGMLGGLSDLIKTYAPLKGMPTKATIKGVGTIDVGPNEGARRAALAYAKESGIPYTPPSTYAKVDPVRAKAIADAFEAMPHNPSDPATAASYNAMINETKAQYQHMKDAGVNVEFMPHGADPYAASPRLMAKDLAENNHMYVYPTAEGFGAGEITDNPLLGDSGEHFNGVPATHNDLFRAVHDYFGHAKEGVGFRANGEENAWRQHAGMYSDAARPAMTTETRGQNSYVNFGPNAARNKLASSADTQYAPQKIGLLPEGFSTPEQEMHFLHMSNLNTPTAELDPSFYGTGIKGAEARRGGTKTTSLYPHDIDAKDIEQGLESKTPYRVSVPKTSMYDANADALGLKTDARLPSGALDMNAYEDAIRGAGYAGYHVPQAEGVLRGQGRLFGKTPATRLGPGAPAEAEEDLSQGFAEGGEVGTALGGLGRLLDEYAPQAEHLANAVAEKGQATYNPTSGAMHTSGYAVPMDPHRAVTGSEPDMATIHEYLTNHADAFDENPDAALHITGDGNGNHMLAVAHHEPDFNTAMDLASRHDMPGIHDIGTGDIHPVMEPYREYTGLNSGKTLGPGDLRAKYAADQSGLAPSILTKAAGINKAGAAYLTPDELSGVAGRAPNVTKFNQIMAVLPKAHEMASVAKAGEPKRGWYRASSQAIADVFGPQDAPRFAGLLAALSPQTDVATNLKNALKTWTNWDTAGRPTDPDMIKGIMGASVQGSKGEASVLPAWQNNSITALTHPDPHNMSLSGFKVDSFMRNLMNDTQAVTNDAWMANYGFGDPAKLRAKGLITDKQVPQALFSGPNGYSAMSSRVRAAADINGTDPYEVQESTWSVAKALYELAHGGVSREGFLQSLEATHPDIAKQLALPNHSAEKVLEMGALTPGVINSTPDFGSLLKQPEYGDLLANKYRDAIMDHPTPIWHDPVSLSPADEANLQQAARRLDQLGAVREK